MSYIGAVPNSATYAPSIFYSNAQSITVSYSFIPGQNTMSSGVITHSTGVLTIPSGAVWKVL